MAEEEIINLPSQMNIKVPVNGPGTVDFNVFTRAEKVITQIAEQYLDLVKPIWRNFRPLMSVGPSQATPLKIKLHGPLRLSII
jgi:hypothetical protein